MARLGQLLWASNTAVTLALLVLLVRHKIFRRSPAFVLYTVTNLLQALVLYFIYRRWGYASTISWQVGWAMDLLTTMAKAIAVAELCRQLLGAYRGVWAFAWRTLVGSAVLVTLVSLITANHRWELLLPNVQRALELAMASVVVLLLVFVRYYEVETPAADRGLTTGICFYSCFGVLNDTLLEKYLYSYAELWSVLGLLAFLASLLTWIWAFRKPMAAEASENILVPAGFYGAVMPELNLRLQLLNEQLARFWRVGDTRP